MNEILKINNLSGGYQDGVDILRGISMEVQQGHIIGIIGYNGSGKSTFCKAIMNMIPFRKGQILFEGEDVTSLTTSQLSHRGISYMQQGGRVFENLSVWDNLQLAMGNSQLPTPNSQLWDIIPLLHLPKKDLQHVKAKLLARTQKYELALAMTLIANPSLIILDEPGASYSGTDKMYKIINAVREKLKTTIILIEQNDKSVFDICNKIVMFEQGKVVDSSIYGLRNLTAFISKNDTSINKSILAKGSRQLSIRVDSENPLFDSRNDCNAIIQTSSNTLIKGCKNTIIPNSVTSIGEFAFLECSGLTSIYIPDGVTEIREGAFTRCSNLNSVTIPNSMTNIGDSAFEDCSNLTSVTINSNAILTKSSLSLKKIFGNQVKKYILGDCVISIGKKAFYGCSSLNSVTIPDTVTNIGDSAFEDCSNLISVTIPNSVTSIGKSAFFGCKSLTSIAIPDGVTEIREGAFTRCSNLNSVTIPDTVTNIGDSAFEDCSNLISVTIPNSVTSIGKSAFFGCKSLTSIAIPNGVTEIREGAFTRCSNLNSVTIPDTVTNIEDSAFEDCSILTSVTIPDSVTSIGGRAFYGCAGLTSVTIPYGVKTIGEHAFDGCSGLEAIVIPNSVTVIEESTFSRCSSLTSITIPKGISSIEKGAFSGCIRLIKVLIPNSVQYIKEGAFSDSPINEIILPKSISLEKKSFDKMTKIKRAKVFISYSWEDEEHKKWVRKLAEDLDEHGIYVIFDKGTLHAGDSLIAFMKKISESETNSIICIMTPEYKTKAEERTGGIGEEYRIIKEELEGGKEYKYIPILRKGTKEESLTKEFEKLAFLDFTNDNNYTAILNELVNTIFNRIH